MLCEATYTDIGLATVLAEKYSSKVYVQRYEDFVIDPYKTLDNLLEFLELLPEPVMDIYLETHTGKSRHTIWFLDKNSSVQLLLFSVLIVILVGFPTGIIVEFCRCLLH